MTEPDVRMQEYLKALREESEAVPETAVDWEAFHQRLDAAAELPLARLRRSESASDVVSSAVPNAAGSAAHTASHTASRPASRPRPPAVWWEYVARWSRAALPLAAAAGIVLGFVIRASPRLDETVSSDTLASNETTGADAQSAFVSAVIGRGEVGTATSLLLPAASDVFAGTAGTAEAVASPPTERR